MTDDAVHAVGTEALRLFGEVSDLPRLDWSEVDRRLAEAPVYWVTARSAGHPHPRPVWGVWWERSLALSIGGPVLGASLHRDPVVTVHLESGTDVVILEGMAEPVTEPDAAIVDAYDTKYRWSYSYDEHGPLTRVAPATVICWRAAGWAGRDGFEAVGRWSLA